jgi:hypothetical protein
MIPLTHIRAALRIAPSCGVSVLHDRLISIDLRRAIAIKHPEPVAAEIHIPNQIANSLRFDIAKIHRDADNVRLLLVSGDVVTYQTCLNEFGSAFSKKWRSIVFAADPSREHAQYSPQDVIGFVYAARELGFRHMVPHITPNGPEGFGRVLLPGLNQVVGTVIPYSHNLPIPSCPEWAAT